MAQWGSGGGPSREGEGTVGGGGGTQQNNTILSAQRIKLALH